MNHNMLDLLLKDLLKTLDLIILIVILFTGQWHGNFFYIYILSFFLSFFFLYLHLYLFHFILSREFTGYDFKDIGTFRGQEDCKCIDVPIIDTWREMEKLVDEGLVKTIGVSNFTISMLEELLKEARIPPAVNEVELHPSLPQQDLVDYCAKKNIALIAYSPIGNPGYSGKNMKITEEPKVKKKTKTKKKRKQEEKIIII